MGKPKAINPPLYQQGVLVQQSQLLIRKLDGIFLNAMDTENVLLSE